MGRVKTAAAKKYHETGASSDNDSIVESKRSSRSKKSSAKSDNKSTPRKSGRPSRGTRQSSSTNGKKGASSASEASSNSEDDEPIISPKQPTRSSRGTRNSVANEKQNGKESSSSSDSETEAPPVNRKRKTPASESSVNKAKTSTSSATPKKTPSEKSSSSKKKKAEESRYEVEEILDHKFEDNKKYFLIRWKGYGSDVDSWESSYNISCPALLAKYYEKHPEASFSAKTSSKKKKKKNLVPRPRELKIDEQLEYDSNWDENEDYEVERILDVQFHRNNKRDFLVRWKGYSSKSDSWEPEENLDCEELIKKFMDKVETMKNVSLKELRPVRSQTQRFTLMTQESARRLSKRNVGRQRAVYYDCDE